MDEFKYQLLDSAGFIRDLDTFAGYSHSEETNHTGVHRSVLVCRWLPLTFSNHPEFHPHLVFDVIIVSDPEAFGVKKAPFRFFLSKNGRIQ